NRMRVVADAHFGDIISVMPARPSRAVNYYRGPRIIEVPDYDEHDEADSGGAAGRLMEDDAEPAPPPSRAAPKPQRRSAAPAPAPRWKPSRAAAPPPSAERRAVLSAPPPPAESLSPIYPTPK